MTENKHQSITVYLHKNPERVGYIRYKKTLPSDDVEPYKGFIIIKYEEDNEVKLDFHNIDNVMRMVVENIDS